MMQPSHYIHAWELAPCMASNPSHRILPLDLQEAKHCHFLNEINYQPMLFFFFMTLWEKFFFSYLSKTSKSQAFSIKPEQTASSRRAEGIDARLFSCLWVPWRVYEEKKTLSLSLFLILEKASVWCFAIRSVVSLSCRTSETKLSCLVVWSALDLKWGF